jgi:hypothetical protein
MKPDKAQPESGPRAEQAKGEACPWKAWRSLA